jgi:hypothetical protein
MAVNRDIVATRKLNKKNKARLGRGGDTKIREVDGRDSHVNALEAYLIDVDRKAGEDYAKRVGAGTTNPLTGMPEYHPVGYTWDSAGDMKFEAHDDSQHTHENIPSGDYEYGWDYGNEIPNITDPNTGGAWTAPTGRQTYETLSGYDPEQLETYLQSEFDMADDSMQYIEGFKQEPFGFIGEQQALTTDKAFKTKGFTERGLESTYGATMGALGSQQAALGRTTGRGLGQAGKGRDIAASRSGLATSGTITQAYETQKKDLFQDYTAGMGDIGRERGTALESLTLGKDIATSDYEASIAGADLDFRQAEYLEKKRQLDELYADVGAIPT